MTKNRARTVDLRTQIEADDVFARGDALQATVPSSAHESAAVGAGRPDVLDFVEASNQGRLANLIPLRIGRMIASPFAFFRGAAGLMAADLATSPVTGLTAQLCGDAHAANFGLYGTPDGQIVMDINDFDETLPGPWEWDLKRLAASLVLAGREGGVSENGCIEAAEDAVKSYRRTIRDLAELPFLQSWNALPDKSVLERAKADALLDDFDKAAQKARRNTSEKVAAKWTAHLEDHETGIRRRRFIDDPPVLTHVDRATADAVTDGLELYVESLRESRRNLITRFAVSDVAFRIVGTGSVGLRSYIALLHGNRDEVLVLQLKQARPSALSAFLPVDEPKHEGKRISARRPAGAGGIGHPAGLDDHRRPPLHRAAVPKPQRGHRSNRSRARPSRRLRPARRRPARACAYPLARSAGARRLLRRRHGTGRGDRRYAVSYADQTEADHAILVAAVKSGRVAAEPA